MREGGKCKSRAGPSYVIDCVRKLTASLVPSLVPSTDKIGFVREVLQVIFTRPALPAVLGVLVQSQGRENDVPGDDHRRPDQVK